MIINVTVPSSRRTLDWSYNFIVQMYRVILQGFPMYLSVIFVYEIPLRNCICDAMVDSVIYL